ncbi:kinase [Verrucomicrobia bacterium LW23]|nr:kinase [Verrucomicrobia bacterium LW23]
MKIAELELVLLIGLQASGKSTYCREHFYATHVRLNLDMLRTRHRERVLFKACLEGKARVVIDNTNLTQEDRARYIVPAKAAHYTVRGYFMQSRLEECLRYNKERKGDACIPDSAIAMSSRKLQLPLWEEGFDTLYFVRKLEGGGFVTEDWKP